ncbi:hypothetical protein F5J12DRAFT_779593 [Pisolithus orientalis]|uniref:uncharacterized protein n=1 Tax=Pisolithus orientalis TaxID=936130 RepID=UPI002224F33C|nr:uncharacterized protein F5J12DRAFT_779593 [Pisolithus orientalis]KAI6030436.1 hypothetical protein F5J12DRAFT_779593 [Pisolithus orientalis]
MLHFGWLIARWLLVDTAQLTVAGGQDVTGSNQADHTLWENVLVIGMALRTIAYYITCCHWAGIGMLWQMQAAALQQVSSLFAGSLSTSTVVLVTGLCKVNDKARAMDDILPQPREQVACGTSNNIDTSRKTPDLFPPVKHTRHLPHQWSGGAGWIGKYLFFVEFGRGQQAGRVTGNPVVPAEGYCGRGSSLEQIESDLLLLTGKRPQSPSHVMSTVGGSSTTVDGTLIPVFIGKPSSRILRGTESTGPAPTTFLIKICPARNSSSSSKCMHEHAYAHPHRVVIRKKRTFMMDPKVVPSSDVNIVFSDPESHGHITPRFFEPDTKY